MPKKYDYDKPRHRQKLAAKVLELLRDFGFIKVKECSSAGEHHEFEVGNSFYIRVGTRIINGVMRRTTCYDSFQVYGIKKVGIEVEGLFRSEMVPIHGTRGEICDGLMFKISQVYEHLMMDEDCEHCGAKMFRPIGANSLICSSFCQKKELFWRERPPSQNVLKRKPKKASSRV